MRRVAVQRPGIRRFGPHGGVSLRLPEAGLARTRERMRGNPVQEWRVAKRYNASV